MNALVNLSNIVIPVLIFYIIATGLMKKTDIYSDFINGATSGFHTVIRIMPTLIGLMVAVGILRASGFLDFIGGFFAIFTEPLNFPSELVPVVFVRMFSSSAATGMVIDIFKNHGPDSTIGMMTSIMMSCTETIFYTMSVYFMSGKVTKTRYTLKGALVATMIGVIISVILTNLYV